MLIGLPSLLKTPAMQAVIKPLADLAGEALKCYELAIQAFKIQMEAWKIRKKASEEIYKKDCKESLKKGLGASISVKFHCEEAPKEPKRKRYKTDDSTIEKLGKLLIENPQGILLFRDELSGFLHSFEKQGRENDRQFFLESWSGKKDFDVDRIGRGSLHVPALFLSIFGSIQPGPLSQYVRSTIHGGVGDDGFLQRFQVMVWPDVKPDWELVEDPLDGEREAAVCRIFESIDKLEFDSDGQPIILEFTEEAQKLFNEWQKKHETWLRSRTLPVHLEAHFAKYKKLLAALCLILEYLKEMSEEDKEPTEISQDTLENAISWLQYLESHAYRVYGSGAHATPKAAKELLRHVRAGDLPEPFSIRDVYHGNHWSGLASSGDVEEVLIYLVEKGYLACATVKTNGRPSQKYWAHPKIFE